MTSPQAVARMIDKRLPKPARVGFITAVDLGAQLVTVAFEDGSTTSSLSWASSAYTSPAVGDRVLVIPTSTGWVVSSKVTPRPVTVPDQQVRVPAVHSWQGYIPTPDTGGVGWSWYEGIGSSGHVDAYQGPSPSQAGDGLSPARWVLRASVLTWGSPAELVPSGATISQAQVVLRVRATQQDLVAPVLYGHTYTAQPSGSPSFAAGYGPLRFPRVGVGEQTVLTVPAAWVTAWLAGTITGFGLYSTDVVDGAYFQDRFDVVDGALVWRTTGNADLLITYSGGDAT